MIAFGVRLGKVTVTGTEVTLLLTCAMMLEYLTNTFVV